MDEVFPLRTYTSRKRRGFSYKAQFSSYPNTAGQQREGGTKMKDKDGASVKRRTPTAKNIRKKRLKSTKTNSRGRRSRKKENKQTGRSPQKFELTFGMFGSDAECRADDLTSEDAKTTESKLENTEAVNVCDRIDPAVEMLPSEEMECQDRVTDWLSKQTSDESDLSSIEILREEVVTVAERKGKCFPGKFYENVNKVLHAAVDYGHQAGRQIGHISDDLIRITDSPEHVVEYTSTAMTGTGFSGGPTFQGTEPSTETGTYTMSTNRRSTTAQSSGVRKSADCYITADSVIEVNDAGLSPISYEEDLQENREPVMKQRALQDISLTDSLKEKEKCEKTPGKRTSFAIPGSPVKIHKSKRHKPKISPPTSVPRSSTRLFLTNIDQGDDIPQVSSIHGDTDREGRLINSEVSTSGRQTKVPQTPDIQVVNKQQFPRLTSTPNRKTSTPNKDDCHFTPFEVTNKQQFPRLTSTPNRKTSTPNKDDCQFTPFEFDLSSVSAVHSEEEELLLHQSERDVVSDEHMDLSKTRIDEHEGEYIRPPAQDKIIFASKKKQKTSSIKQGLDNEDKTDDAVGDEVSHSDTIKAVKLRKGSNKKPLSGSGEPHGLKTLTQSKMDKGRRDSNSPHGMSAQHRKCTDKERKRQNSVEKGEIRGRKISSTSTTHKSLQNGVPLEPFCSFFNVVKGTDLKDRHTGSISENRIPLKDLPVCTLNGNFSCPKKESVVWQFYRDCQISYEDRCKSLPRDDLDF